MLYTVHLKEVVCHTVRVRLPGNADSADVYKAAVEARCPDTIEDCFVTEEQIFIGDSPEYLSEELNLWCNARGIPQQSADDLISREDLSELEYAYLKLFIARWDAAVK